MHRGKSLVRMRWRLVSRRRWIVLVVFVVLGLPSSDSVEYILYSTLVVPCVCHYGVGNSCKAWYTTRPRIHFLTVTLSSTHHQSTGRNQSVSHLPTAIV